MGVALEEEKLGFIFPRCLCLGFGDRDFKRDQQIGNNSHITSAKAGQQE